MQELRIDHDGAVRLTEVQRWEWEDVRRLCIDHDYYTRGTSADYEDLMHPVNGLKPTPVNMMRIAQNIANHSVNVGGEADMELILFYIANDVVMRDFEI